MPEQSHWLLWDGDCGFCRRSVEWVRSRDQASEFRAIPYQKAPSPPMTDALRRACADAVHVITPEGNVLRAGRAVLYVLERVGFPRTARILRVFPFVLFVELGYVIVAKNRRFFSRIMFRNG